MTDRRPVPLLDVAGVRAPRYGLLDVSFSVGVGHRHAVVVPAAAGTALLEIIAGITHPDHGQVYLGGLPVTGRPVSKVTRQNVGYLPVNPRWYPARTVAGVLETAVRWQVLHRRPTTTSLTGPQQITDALHRCGLHPFAGADPGQLGSDWARMLDLAVILLHRPHLILLDQPPIGVAGQAALLRHVINDLPDTVAVLSAVAAPADAAGFADRVTVIDHGSTRGRPESGTGRP